MKQYPLWLKIADLPILLYISKKQDFDFLFKKYVNYVIPNPNRKVAAIISFGAQYEGGKIPVFTFFGNPIDQFHEFSEFFRKVMAGILNLYDGALLHASSVVFKNKGLIFIGQKGAGKTTIRTLLSHHTSLGDDTAVVRKKGKRFYLYGSPFYQRTNRAYPNRKVIIKGVFILKQAHYNSIFELPFERQLFMLSKNTFISGLEGLEEENASLKKTIFLFASQNLIYKLFFLKSLNVEKVLMGFFHTAQPRISIERSLSKSSASIRGQFKDHFIWTKGWADDTFLAKCFILKERSWGFEFGPDRKVSVVVQKISKRTGDAYHKSWVLKKSKRFERKPVPPLILVVRHGKDYVILDGNHSALAWYSLSQRENCPPAFVLSGELKEGRSMPKKLALYL